MTIFVARSVRKRKVCDNSPKYVILKVSKRVYIFTVITGEVPTEEDTENLLNDCIMLNPYSVYFLNNTGFESIQIVCGTKCYDSHFEMTLNCKKDIIEKQVQFHDSLAIDELVKTNTSAKNASKDISGQVGLYPYDFVFVQLEKI